MSVKTYMDAVADLGCMVLDCPNEPELHHPRFCAGMGQRAPDWFVIPLCAEHHRGGYSIHGSPELFTKVEGTEEFLLAKTIAAMWGRYGN